MHRATVAILLAASLPLAVSAQQAPGAHGITRDQFVQRRAEMAGRQFDAIDTNHAGTITRDQIRAFRQTHGHAGAGPAE